MSKISLTNHKLGELCNISSAKRIFENEYVSSGIPFIRGLEISNGSILKDDAIFDCYISKERYQQIVSKYGKPSKGDILITAVGTIGNLCYLTKDIDFYFKDGNIIWFSKINDCCYSNWLYYYMKCDYFKGQLKYSMIGAVQKALTIDMLNKVIVPLPPLPIQRKIAAVLTALDDKIALNRRINDKLEAMAKRLYDYWFVQFDFPDENGRPYKSSGGKMVWNETLKREIPAGWEVNNLYYIADYINGLACQNYRPKDNKKSLPVIKIKEMNEGIGADTERCALDIPNRFIVLNGDILFSWSATLMVILWNGEIGGLNQHIFKVVPKSYFTKSFVYQILKSYIINFQNIALSRKTTMGHITSEHISLSSICIPPEYIVSLFSRRIDSIYKCISTNEREIARLTSLRDRLLPLLMNGQVVVD